MSSFVSGFDPKFFRPCIFPILADLGYGTSVSINNGVTSGQYVTDMLISISILSENGIVIASLKLGKLAPGEIAKFDTRELLVRLNVEPVGHMLGVVHLIPSRWDGCEEVELDRNDQLAHVGASDDFIEFRQEPRGVITGVAYQMGPQNDFRFNRTRTTLIQAPKVIVSNNVDTIFALINVSTSFNYNDMATIDYWVYGQNGEKISRGKTSIPPWTVRYLSISELLEATNAKEIFAAQGGMGMLLALSEDAGIVPLSMTRNLKTGAIACDHTLPPIYYFSTWGGPMRVEANKALKGLVF